MTTLHCNNCVIPTVDIENTDFLIRDDEIILTLKKYESSSLEDYQSIKTLTCVIHFL